MVGADAEEEKESAISICIQAVIQPDICSKFWGSHLGINVAEANDVPQKSGTVLDIAIIA